MSKQGNVSSPSNFSRGEMKKMINDSALAVIAELHQEEKLCDVVIKVGGVEFNAHKIILCSCSSYFRTLFTGAWATSVKETYSIPGVLPGMMHLIINYAYTRSVPVTEDNVVDILEAADQLLVPGMVQACCFFLEDRINLRNCISIWRLVDFYHCPEFRDKVLLFILHHFEEIISISQEFLDLSEHQLAAIIDSDHLNVKEENMVFDLVLQWINHLPDQRRGQLSMLLPKVRLGLMSADDFKSKVIDNAMFNNSIEFVSVMNNAVMAYIEVQSKRLPNCASNNPMSRPRLPPVNLLVTGGKDDITAAKSFELYDIRSDRWATLGTGISLSHHGAVVLDGYVYLVGGCKREAHLNTVQRFDLLTSTWKNVVPMKSARCYVSVAVQNGLIYAMGGYNGHTYLNSAECYNPKTDRWTMIEQMNSRRCGASAASLHGKIYVCGGFNGHRTLATVELFDPDVNQWTRISQMSCCRSGLGVVAYNGRIYAVGGTRNGSTHLRSVEAYNPHTNRWCIVPSMYNCRSNFGIEVVEDQLFVVGGEDSFGIMSAVECYDEETGMWCRVSGIEIPRSGLSCCLVHGLQNMAETLFPRGFLMLPNMTEAGGGSS